jgi:TRAP-type transport system small permease protein
MRGSRTGLAGSVARRLVQAERVVGVVLLAGVFGLMAAQVIARYVFRSPIAWSEELARLALIWLTFIAASFVMADGRHITVDVISRPMSRRGRLVLETIGSAVVVTTCAMLVPSGLEFATRLGQVRSAALELPMLWWYLSAVVGFVLLALHATINLALAWHTGRPVWDRSPDEPGRPDAGAVA